MSIQKKKHWLLKSLVSPKGILYKRWYKYKLKNYIYKYVYKMKHKKSKNHAHKLFFKYIERKQANSISYSPQNSFEFFYGVWNL